MNDLLDNVGLLLLIVVAFIYGIEWVLLHGNSRNRLLRRLVGKLVERDLQQLSPAPPVVPSQLDAYFLAWQSGLAWAAAACIVCLAFLVAFWILLVYSSVASAILGGSVLLLTAWATQKRISRLP